MIILYSDQKLPFGKYEGKLIDDVLTHDPDYFKKQLHPKVGRRYSFSDEVVHKAYGRGVTTR